MEKKTITLGSVGILGLISLLISGGIYFNNQSELDNAYICLATGEWGIFYGGVSSTGLTAYPYAENRTDYKRCKDGKTNSAWVSLENYLIENDLNPEDFIFNDVQATPTNAKSVCCSPGRSECTVGKCPNN